MVELKKKMDNPSKKKRKPLFKFREITFQTFPCLFAIRKVGQQKILSSQRKIWLGFQESGFLLFWAKNTFRKL
jgi:hypothetical protein